MLELPEVLTVANQVNEEITGKRIMNVTAAHTPHKLAWYHGKPEGYHGLLAGKTIGRAGGYGCMVEIPAEDAVILVGDGVGLKYHRPGESRPDKHQLMLELEDESAVSASVQMYGGIWCFTAGGFDNPYYKVAREKPSPLSGAFDEAYFDRLVSLPEVQRLSAKALLATEQRIPGLGNGVLQDTLYNAGIHPKRKVSNFSDKEREKLFGSVKATLAEMTFQGGRDTERDLYGCPGGYRTKLGKNTAGKPCPECGSIIRKESYMGGSIYYCPGCQAV